MRILMLSWEYPPRIVGGISRVVYDLSSKIRRKEEMKFMLLTCWEQGTKEFEKDKNVFVHRIHTYDS